MDGRVQQGEGRKPTSLKALMELPVDTIATIGMCCVFRCLGRAGRVAELTQDMGRRVEIELEGKALEAADPKAAKALLKLGQGDLTEAVLEKRFRALVEENEAALHWDDDTRVLVGQTILNVVLRKLSDVFYQKTITQNGLRHAVVMLTDQAAAAIVEMEDLAAMEHLPLLPMVAQPRKWESNSSGAYYCHRLARLVPMVRTRSKEQRKLVKEAIADGSMQEVLDALNAIQDTRWEIDDRVLDVILWARETGLRPSSSFPTDKTPEVPEKVSPEEWEKMSKEEQTARRRQRRSVRQVCQALAVDKGNFDRDMATAQEMAQHNCFYLPHSLDFRGRTYAVPYFNHQRSDHLKALFRFADGVPLGEDGGRWLKIHLANCGDFEKVSKKPFEVRTAWVDENASNIIATVMDPEAMADWWTKADSPFCFLQACFEYVEWAESGFDPEFLSKIPGAADGSCSGLQHYSAITRSADEAYHVNLVPRSDVGDIYQVTADAAMPSLQAEAKAGDASCQIILDNGFGRGEAKRNVMTYFYGSARFGMREQHMQDLMRPLADKVAMGKLEKHPYEQITLRVNKDTKEETWAPDGGYSCARALAEHIYSAVTTVAAKADEAANWIQQVAAALAHESLSMIWRTQTGFPVVQRYSEFTTKEVNLWLYSRTIRPAQGTDKVDHEGNTLSRVRVLLRQAPTSRVDKKTMRSAASPNVIHSMDAAHLHKSVAKARALGITAFSMIHDSFGTHLGNMEAFSRIVREAFVECYEDYCPLQELDRYARSVLSEEGIEKLPPLPSKGNLDLNLVLEAPFAFA
ncbi:DNA-directed RNA polymerase [Novosphingobium panipatense]